MKRTVITITALASLLLFGAASCDASNSGGSDPHPGRIVAKDHIKRGVSWVNGYSPECKTFGKCWHNEVRLECWQFTIEYEDAFGGKPHRRVKCVTHTKYAAAKVGSNYHP